LFLLDRMFVGGLKFVLQRVADAVDTEMNDVERLREELLAAQMRLELGEIDEEQFTRLEADLLARLRSIEEARRAAASEASRDAHGLDEPLGSSASAGPIFTVETEFEPEPEAELLEHPPPRAKRRRR
jgi:hypothetical protein